MCHSGTEEHKYFMGVDMVEQKAQLWCLCSSEWLFQLRNKALELFLITRAALWQPTQKSSLGAGKGPLL